MSHTHSLNENLSDVIIFPNIFITVGTTEFDDFIKLIDQKSEFIDILQELGCQKLTIQIGRGIYEPNNIIINSSKHNINVEFYRFKSSLKEDMEKADLIISHCGAGSILESLTMKKILIVIVNTTLQENHQIELAEELSSLDYCLSTNINNFFEDLLKLKSRKLKLIPFPIVDYNLFPNLVNEMLFS